MEEVTTTADFLIKDEQQEQERHRDLVYTDILNSIPNEKCTIPILLDAIIEECCMQDTIDRDSFDSADPLSKQRCVTTAADVSAVASYIDGMFENINDMAHGIASDKCDQTSIT